MMRFKICGLRDVEAALAAANSGADLLGFVFVRGVRRQLTLDQGRSVIGRVAAELGADRPALVGLFANQSVDDVNHIIEECSLEYAQLCGSEQPDYWDRILASVIKQVRVKPDDSAEATLARVRDVAARGRRAQLDAYERGALGGTGRSFDWNVAAQVAREYDIVLAGGLSAENVANAIRQVRPWMVDVSSGVETNGIKDPSKIHEFARAVHSASSENGSP